MADDLPPALRRGGQAAQPEKPAQPAQAAKPTKPTKLGASPAQVSQPEAAPIKKPAPQPAKMDNPYEQAMISEASATPVRAGDKRVPIRKGHATGGIEYEVKGDGVELLEVTLQPGQSVIGDVEGMFYYEHGIAMKVQMSSSSAPQKQTIMQKIFGLGKGLLMGEQMFVMTYTNTTQQPKRIAFTMPKVGKIAAIDLADLGDNVMCLKNALLCATNQVRVTMATQREIGSGMFGAAGVQMQKLQGSGTIFVHTGGIPIERQLQSGEVLNVSLGSLMLKQTSVDLRVQTLPNVGLTGQGYTLMTLKGPGKVWLQSLPLNKLQERMSISTEEYLIKKKKISKK
jgi:uncharacterized protein (AIM24 family)